jgi:uncharacterized membrane protein YeaQ/YmgE (transglycosylase-associated protein family)
MLMLLSWILFGAIVGALARFLLPGRQPMGFVATILLGIVGSFAGGMVANLLTGQSLLYLHGVGVIGSVLGAMAVLAVFIGIRRASPA